MKITKTNSALRILCAVLAVLTMVVSIPLFAVESKAADETVIAHSFDFTGGTVDETLKLEGYINSIPSTNKPKYASKDGKTVLYGSKAYFTVKTDVSALKAGKFFVEMRFNLASIGNNELSLIALNMKTSASETQNAAVPLVRFNPTGEGYLEMRGSDKGYDPTNKKVSLNEWHTVKTVVDPSSNMVDLYFDGEFVNSLQMVNLYSMSTLRFMHDKESSWYIDTISYGTFVEETPEEPEEPEEPKVPILDPDMYNEYIDFESFGEGADITSEAILGINTVSTDRVSKFESSGLKVKSDNGNMVSYNTGKEYYACIYEKDVKLASTTFSVSMDVKFSSFPVHTEGKPVAIVSWVYTNAAGTTNYQVFFRVDSNGNLLDLSNNLTGFSFELDNWANINVLCDGTTGEYDVFLDGEYVFSSDIGAPKTTDTLSYIRLFNNTNNKATYSVCVDNIMLYESERTALPKEADVIWDVDFEDIEVGTQMNANVWNGLSDVADAYKISAPSAYPNTYKVAEFNGGKAFKATNATDSCQTDLYVGNGSFDPLKTDGLSLKFDFMIENFDETVSDTSKRIHHVISWRRLDSAGSAKAMRIFGFNSDKNFVFMGTAINREIEANKIYPIEITFNSGRNTAALKIDGKLVVDSYPVSTSSSTIDGLNRSYFLDDAGNKHTLPYTGFVKSYLCDSDGCAITNADGSFIFVDKLVARKNFYTDMLRIGQGVANTTADYYIDNLLVVKLEPDEIFSTDFTGWENFDPSEKNTDYRFNIGDATLVNDNENTYVKIAESTSQKAFWGFGDRDMEYYGKDLFFETNVNFVTKSAEAGSKTSFISLVEQQSSTENPFQHENNTTLYRHFLRRDELGYLYTRNGDTPIGQLKFGEWTNIGIHIHGNGTTWTSYDVYIDGEYVASDTLPDLSKLKNYSIRYRVINNEIWFDNISVYYPKQSIEGIKFDFESDSSTNAAIMKLDGGWMYGELGATRTNTDGDTVVTAQLLGDVGSKYLRINHSRLKDNTTAYIDAFNDLFIDEKDYLIETSIRFTSLTSSTLNIAEIYTPMAKKSAPVLAARGDTNIMYINLRGVTYDLVFKDGTPVTVAGIDDSEFTRIAILVDSVKNTYTVYVNGAIVYYNYDEAVLPCADMPLYFVDKEADSAKNKVRLLEISQYKYQDGILDIDYLNFVPLYNGIGSEIKGTQTKTFSDEGCYGVRFVAGVDAVYGNSIGCELTAVYTDQNGLQTKMGEDSSNLVFEMIGAEEHYITAESLGASYLSAIEVISIPMETAVEFTVKPYVNHGGVRIYGESYTISFSNGEIVE